MGELSTAMVSSTINDLPKHRQHVRDACDRMGVRALMQEHLSAADATAIEVSHDLVDQADVYLGVIGFRYGTIMPGEAKSITEMEYDWALARRLPRFIYLMDEGHPLTAGDVDERRVRINEFRKRLESDRVRGTFASPADLRALVIQSLAEQQRAEYQATIAQLTREAEERGDKAEESPEALALAEVRRLETRALHVVRSPPTPPEPYIAHPYTLLETRSLIGRRDERSLLKDWLTGSTKTGVSFLALVAVGGMGKSALTWTWFMDDAPRERPDLAGRMWWSFYETDASFDNFVTRALAYTTGRSITEIGEMPEDQQEFELLAVLDAEPYLIVLDGLERVLVAYAAMDAARLTDSELDERAAQATAGERGHSPVTAQSFFGQHRLRQATDPRVGRFLRKLVGVRATRILASTRLFPAELQTPVDDTVPGAAVHFLQGLSDDDAVALWQHFGATGARDDLLRLFSTFDNYPLLIRALAGEVDRYRPAPGDFDRWRADHGEFDPFSLPLTQIKSHILEFALRGLTELEERLLHTIAAFRSPATYATLAALLVGGDKPFPDDVSLDKALTELEDRGLVGWDRRANRYDQHPVVRGVAWQGLDSESRTTIYGALEHHFSSLPKASDEEATAEDLTAAYELLHALVHLKRFEDAWEILEDRIIGPTIRFGSWESMAEAIETMMDPASGLPRGLTEEAGAAFFYLGLANVARGRPDRGVAQWRKGVALMPEDDPEIRAIPLAMLCMDLVNTGELAEAAMAVEALNSLSASLDEASYDADDVKAFGDIVAGLLGSVTATTTDAVARLASGLKRMDDEEGVTFFAIDAHIVRDAIWRGDTEGARAGIARHQAAWADRPELIAPGSVELLALEGAVAVRRSDFETAENCLLEALKQARSARLGGAEIVALLHLAELHHARSDFRSARECLADLDELAVRGNYRLRRADAAILRAELERSGGNKLAAAEAAREAFELAWCDGEPYSYAAGVRAARKLLASLNVDIPDVKPFDREAHAARSSAYLSQEIIEREREKLLERLRDQRAEVRRDVFDTVLVLWGPDVGIVSSALTDNDAGIRAHVAGALARSAAPSAVDLLTERFGDDDGAVRAAAARGVRDWLLNAVAANRVDVGFHASESPGADLGDLIETAFDLGQQPRTVPLFGRETPPSIDPVPGLERLIDDDADDARAAALTALALWAPDRTEALLASALADGDAEVRVAGIDAARLALCRLGEEELHTLLRDQAPSVRSRIAAAVAAQADTRFVPELIDFLGDPEYGVQLAAVRALGALSDARAVDALTAVLGTTDDDALPAAAADALGRIGGADAARSLANAMLAERSGDAAYAALRSIWGPEREEVALDLLHDPLPTIRARGASLLAATWRVAAVEALRAALSDADPGVRAAAVGALSESARARRRYSVSDSPDPEADLDAVATLVRDPARPVREAAVRAVANIGGDRAGDLLASLLDDEELGGAAVIGLVAAHDPRAAERVAELLDLDESEDRQTALKQVTAWMNYEDSRLLKTLAYTTIDVREPIGLDRLASGTYLSEEETRERYESMARVIPLRLEWLEADAPAGTDGLGT
jgi:HEAT repeat protein